MAARKNLPKIITDIEGKKEKQTDSYNNPNPVFENLLDFIIVLSPSYSI